MFKQSYILLALLAALAPEFLVHAQQNDQSGFISLDCGLPRNRTYTEPSTRLNYTSDAAFIDTGISHSVTHESKLSQQEQAWTLRYFPDGMRNCYKINVTARTRYLIRTTFLYGNYDGLGIMPKFDLHLGGNFWTTVNLVNVSVASFNEILHIPSDSYVHVCLVNTGEGTPFISALELRPISNLRYYDSTGSVESLVFLHRYDIGSESTVYYRFPYDGIDRVWSPYALGDWNQTSTPATVDPNNTDKGRPPSIVTSTGAIPASESLPLELEIAVEDASTYYYFYLHFAELRELEANEYRGFNISIDGNLFYELLSPSYLQTTSIRSSIWGRLNYTFTFNRVANSSLPPILNAFELYSVVDFSQEETEEEDVNAINGVKSSYGVNGRNWDGDPCVPKDYLWTGVNCSYNGFDPPRITALNLSSSGLTGEIKSDIAKLSMLQSLDLSKNNLTGSLPDFLSQMPNLRVINLARNNLSGSVPDELLEKAKNGSLSLRARCLR